MNDTRHWWTVGSQPAVDGVKSSDPVFGFGPKGGYVYQKAFVEFFLTEGELNELEQRSREDKKLRIEKGEADEGMVKWFAGNGKGDYRSNMEKGDVNAVTWGVFGGKEIVTTTLIEEMSFKAWAVSLSLFSRFLSLLPHCNDLLLTVLAHSCRRKLSRSGKNGLSSTLLNLLRGNSSKKSPKRDG